MTTDVLSADIIAFSFKNGEAGVTTTDDGTALDLDRFEVLPEVLYRVPRALALRHDVLTLAADHNLITVAIPDSHDSDTIERIRLATGMHVKALAASRASIRARLSQVYPDGAPPVRNDDSPAMRALDEIQLGAVREGASDVHFEPLPGGGRIRTRVDGVLRQSKELSADLFLPVVSRLKLLAGMDIADRRQPQDGHYVIERGDHAIEARVSSMPTIFGEKVVLRLLRRGAHDGVIDELGMTDRLRRRFCEAIDAPQGFVIVCGPTGSGKTTTLYAAVGYRNRPDSNVCTVEDPVELQIPGITQIQINERAGVTFATALRALLRHDANVVMIGEMRDAETASAAVSAALTGQLILTTLHANDSAAAFERLADLGAPRTALAACVTAVVSQRLVRRLCAHCRRSARLDAATAQALNLPPGGACFMPGGCGACGGSGYSGRAAIFEGLFPDPRLSALVARGADPAEIRACARESSRETILSDGVRRALSGETSFAELLRVVPCGES